MLVQLMKIPMMKSRGKQNKLLLWHLVTPLAGACISPIIDTCIWLKALFGMHVKLKHNEHTCNNTSTETHTTLFHIIKSLFFFINILISYINITH